MGWWGWVRRRLDVLVRKDRAEAELDDEIRFHLEMEVRERVQTGMSPREARRNALIAFGGVERTKEEVRDVRGARVVDDWIQDTRVALRSLVKQPAFLLTVLVTLGLGIGGNVAMLGILDASLLRALPYDDPDRLVMGRVTYDGELGWLVAGPDYLDYQEQAATLQRLAAYTPFRVDATLTGTGDAERVVAPLASHDFFATLGVTPVLGRTFTPEEGEPSAPPVAMLSHGYWQRRFGGDPAVLGRTLLLDGTPTSIVGVLPESFRFTEPADVWRPFVRDGMFAGARQFHNWLLIGRLGPEATLAAAQAEVDGISARLAELYPDSNRGKGLRLTPLREAVAEGYRATLLLLGAAMAIVLLIACANVGGMLLARSSARRSEMAIRSSLGAGRFRLVRQFLAEGTLLVVGATVLGVAIAGWLQRAMLGFVSADALAAGEAGLSPSGIAVAVSIATVTVALFGSLPAAAGTGPGGTEALRSRGGASGGLGAARFRSALVIGQVTLTGVLLMMSALLIQSLARLHRVETGFASDRLWTAEVHLPPGKYADVSRRPLFYGELRDRVAALPGVESVGVVNLLPVRDPRNNVRVAPPAQWGQSGVFGDIAFQRMVLPGYFDALGIPILQGRDVTLDDVRTGPNVIVVSESLALSLFGDQNPLGQTLGVDVGSAEPWVAEVVGVVGDVASSSLAEGQDQAMYFSYEQRSPASMRLAVRTTGMSAPIASRVREILHDLDPDVPLAAPAFMDEILADSLGGRRAVMVLLATFAGVALVLAAVGLYGVLAYQVARRTHEIGVRMALGSSVAGVVRSVVRSGFVLVGIGVVLGIPTSLLAARLIRSLLYEVGPSSPLPYLGTLLFLGAVGAIATLLPARRAARVDPVVSFRAE